MDDLVAACDPSWLQLEADFNRRGNVHTVVRINHGESSKPGKLCELNFH